MASNDQYVSGRRSAGPTFFPYLHHPRFAALLRVYGVRPGLDGVMLDGTTLIATFGVFSLRTDVRNVSGAQVSGPYRWWRAIGARLSLADHGLTFGTTAAHGVCITFVEPVRRVLGPWNHPGLTVTVAEPAELVNALRGRRVDAPVGARVDAPVDASVDASVDARGDA